jgi:hypothetical protein
MPVKEPPTDVAVQCVPPIRGAQDGGPAATGDGVTPRRPLGPHACRQVLRQPCHCVEKFLVMLVWVTDTGPLSDTTHAPTSRVSRESSPRQAGKTGSRLQDVERGCVRSY